MDKLRTYKLLKLNNMFCVANTMFRTAFLRFTGGLLNFEWNEGRYNIPINERICPFFKSDIETEHTKYNSLDLSYFGKSIDIT